MIKMYCDLCGKEIPNFHSEHLVTFETSATISIMDTCDECRANWFDDYNRWYPKSCISEDPVQNTGHWIKDDNPEVIDQSTRCSLCGGRAHLEEYEEGISEALSDYCPHCGAKMEN